MEPNSDPQQDTLAAVPAAWPGIFGVYKYSKAAIQYNLGTNAWLIIFGFIMSAAGEVGLRAGHNNFAGVIGYLLSTLFGAALIIAQIASVRRQKLSLEDALKQGLPLWIKYILLSLLVSITLVVSFILLVIPFFFVLPRLALAPYFLVDRRMGIIEAYKTSWHATKGHLAEPWNVIAGTILISLLSITIIGIPFAIYFYIMYSGALAVYYEMRLQVSTSSQLSTPPQVPTATPPSA